MLTLSSECNHNTKLRSLSSLPQPSEFSTRQIHHHPPSKQSAFSESRQPDGKKRLHTRDHHHNNIFPGSSNITVFSVALSQRSPASTKQLYFDLPASFHPSINNGWRQGQVFWRQELGWQDLGRRSQEAAEPLCASWPSGKSRQQLFSVRFCALRSRSTPAPTPPSQRRQKLGPARVPKAFHDFRDQRPRPPRASTNAREPIAIPFRQLARDSWKHSHLFRIVPVTRHSSADGVLRCLR